MKEDTMGLRHQITEWQRPIVEFDRQALEGSDIRRQMEEMREHISRMETQQSNGELACELQLDGHG